MLTQVEVDAGDIAFQNPNKPVKPAYNKEEAAVQTAVHGWVMAMDGNKYRRVVAPPKPVHIPDISVIQLLVEIVSLSFVLAVAVFLLCEEKMAV